MRPLASGPRPPLVMLMGEASVDIDRIRQLLNVGAVILIAPTAEAVKAWNIVLHDFENPSFTLDKLRIDMEAHEASWNDVPLPLTEQEFRLLSVLCQHPGRAVSFTELLGEIWHSSYAVDRESMRSAIKRLRRKLLEAGASVTIEAVRGWGFRLRSP